MLINIYVYFVQHDDDGDEEHGERPQTTKSRRKPAYTGGLVLEPKRGIEMFLAATNSHSPFVLGKFVCSSSISAICSYLQILFFFVSRVL